ncbi:hypothetical protein O0I10_010204 [Lichtheimia ornata]|uniref:Uncharacterized protein n=1 Tax=Lichtheimia ornata TaxID=688661 RepID=A0AAD7UV43_9FUNG|nr:uncharacterized protein O0I10_010204 [Lichtheimia ornata]KAJ8654129.1 hypothetical protein O0I10_010204 [Lichtheimia ornata]
MSDPIIRITFDQSKHDQMESPHPFVLILYTSLPFHQSAAWRMLMTSLVFLRTPTEWQYSVTKYLTTYKLASNGKVNSQQDRGFPHWYEL